MPTPQMIADMQAQMKNGTEGGDPALNMTFNP